MFSRWGGVFFLDKPDFTVVTSPTLRDVIELGPSDVIRVYPSTGVLPPVHKYTTQ